MKSSNFGFSIFIYIFSIVISDFSTLTPAAAETIRSAVSRSIKNSDARKIAISSIKAQNKSVAISQGERGITLELYGEAALEQFDDSTLDYSLYDGKTHLGRQIGAVATYNIYDGMRSLNALYREATILDTEIIRLSDAVETIALNAAQAYIDVFRRQNIVTISLENIDVHTLIVAQVERQVEAGKLSEPDRFQARDKLLAAKLVHADALASLEDAVSNYQFVIGTRPRGNLSVTSGARLPRSRGAAEANAVRNSYLVKIAQKDIDVFDYQEIIDLADWKPQLDLFVRGGYEKDVEGTPGSETSISSGLSLRWTIYKGGTKANVVARNRDLKMRAHYRKKQIEDEVRNLARRAWNSYIAAQERRTLLDQTVFNNEKILKAFRREFKAAKRPLLEVLDGERALFNLKVRQTNAQAAVAYQEYRILAAQNTLSRHFGLSPYGQGLNYKPDYETRVKAAPHDDFDISAPALE